MSAERETKERLIASARAEFMDKGYARASLRKICANAGMTTGALYFFFDGKEDLFRAIVEPPLTTLVNILQEHFLQDEQILSLPEIYEHREGDHDEITKQLIHHLYQNYDAFILLLTKAQGTAFEDSLDRIVDMIEKRFAVSAGLFTKQSARKPLNSCMQADSCTQINSCIIHWMAHMATDAFIYLLTHEREEQAAVKQMKIIMNFIVKGFMEMLLPPAKTEKP